MKSFRFQLRQDMIGMLYYPVGRNISKILQCAEYNCCVDLVSYLMIFSLCFARFDYCRFVELDYIPMEAGCMVSMRPTKAYGSSKSPSKGLSSARSPDRHGHSESSPSTPRSRFVLRQSLTLDNNHCFLLLISWCYNDKRPNIDRFYFTHQQKGDAITFFSQGDFR